MNFRAVCVLAAFVALAAASCGTRYSSVAIRVTPRFFTNCGDRGEACCGPYRDASGPFGVSHCNMTLGCNVATNRCEQPCGHPGEVCCDGPDTWGFQGDTRSSASSRYYRDAAGNTSLRKSMCADSVCDMTARRCVADCGTDAGQPCCGPQPYLAVASCTKPTLVCRFASDSLQRGTCEACGGLWQIPCDLGEPCREGRERPDSSLCDPCGGVEQLPCLQRGVAPCRPGLVVRRPGGRCNYPPPPPPPLSVSVGVGSSAPSCPPGTIFCGGRCVASDPQNCGRCGNVCSQGTVCEGQQCVADTMCASVGGACVPDTQPGAHCCRNGPTPLACNFKTCETCIRTGEVCSRLNQICCDQGPGFNYICHLDPNSGEFVCGVPDV